MSEVTYLRHVRNLRNLRKLRAGQFPSEKEEAALFIGYLEKAGYGDLAKRLLFLHQTQGAEAAQAVFLDMVRRDDALGMALCGAVYASMGFEISGEGREAIAQQGHDDDALTGNTNT